MSAVAQLERDLIRERVSAGIRNARANGKRLGRPRRSVNQEELRRLRSEGASLRQIAEELGMGSAGTAPAAEPLISTGRTPP